MTPATITFLRPGRFDRTGEMLVIHALTATKISS
jgi:hypothetical protein